jgi:hypothetical protein
MIDNADLDKGLITDALDELDKKISNMDYVENKMNTEFEM